MNGFSPATNPANAGSHTRKCAAAVCDNEYTCGKTAVVTMCKSCVDHCDRCAGTGKFITGNHNGVPTGPGGICFRCNGKGWQSKSDHRRNDYYDTRIMPTRAIGM